MTVSANNARRPKLAIPIRSQRQGSKELANTITTTTNPETFEFQIFLTTSRGKIMPLGRSSKEPRDLGKAAYKGSKL